MLEVVGLAKKYRGRAVLDGVSLQVAPGTVVGILGPNGAGKTTCFHAIVGLVSMDKGAILLDGEDLSEIPMHARARKGIVYLPQEPSVFRHLNVADNVMAVIEIQAELDRAGRKRELERLLDDLKIGYLRQQMGVELSGGERRRVEIARALAARPKYILLDEPFAGVDPISVGDVRHIVQHLKDREIGVLITDHNVREALPLCDYAYILSAGSVLAEGSPEDIIQSQAVRKVYLGSDFRL